MIQDYFELFGVPRRPWLDAEALKSKFLVISGQVHPDRVHDAGADDLRTANREFSEWNAAYHCLKDPKGRLGHFLELEMGGKVLQVHEVPADTADLFIRISGLFRAVDLFLREKGQASSALLKAEMFGKAMEWHEQLAVEQEGLVRERDVIYERIRELDQRWSGGDSADCEKGPVRDGEEASVLTELEELYRKLSYLNRWTVQIQERMVRCTE